jgi:RNA polymerase sigma-70 factor (ECF subfamily)
MAYFDCHYKMDEANCRQILRRARQHMTEGRPRFDTSPERHQRLLQEFLAAASHGYLQDLLSLLSNEELFSTPTAAARRMPP